MIRVRSKEKLGIYAVRAFFLIMLFMFCGCFCAYSYAQQIVPVDGVLSKSVDVMCPAADSGQWCCLDIGRIKFFYRPTADLRRIERRLKLRGRLPVSGYSKPAGESSWQDKIAYRISVIFRRVKNLLEMYPRIENINIRVFDSRKALNDEYFAIFGEKREILSFYVHKNSTIYTSEEAVTDSVLSHELGHVVVDHYFVIRPPEKIREMLSCYVDLHLEG